MGPTRVQAREGGGMTFRDFTEETKEAVVALVAGMRGDRDITPMVHLHSEDGGREIIGVEAQFFAEPGGVEQLVERFIVPLVQERMATQVAWTFTGAFQDGYADPPRLVVAVVMDREVHEAWVATLHPDAGVGDWLNLGSNSTYGLMVGPVQEVLR